MLENVNAYGVGLIVIRQDVQQEEHNTRIVKSLDVNE
jgi:hypothetical protein